MAMHLVVGDEYSVADDPTETVANEKPTAPGFGSEAAAMALISRVVGLLKDGTRKQKARRLAWRMCMDA